MATTTIDTAMVRALFSRFLIAALTSAKFLPHESQRVAPSGFLAPHAGHISAVLAPSGITLTSEAPQLSHLVASFRLTVPHFGQFFVKAMPSCGAQVSYKTLIPHPEGESGILPECGDASLAPSSRFWRHRATVPWFTP